MIRKGLFVLILFGLMNVSFGDVIVSRQKRKNDDPWFGIDKLKHLSSSFVMTTTAFYVQANIFEVADSRAQSNAGLFTISLGFGKECFDIKKPNGIFSWRDLTMDVAGAGLALLFIEVVNR